MPHLRFLIGSTNDFCEKHEPVAFMAALLKLHASLSSGAFPVASAEQKTDPE